MYMLCQKPVWSERTHCAQQALIVIRHSAELRYQEPLTPHQITPHQITPHQITPHHTTSPTYLCLGKVQSGGQVESVRAHHVLRSGSNYGLILSFDTESSHQTYFRNSSSRNSSCSGVKIVLILLVLILLPPPSLLKSSKK